MAPQTIPAIAIPDFLPYSSFEIIPQTTATIPSTPGQQQHNKEQIPQIKDTIARSSPFFTPVGTCEGPEYVYPPEV